MDGKKVDEMKGGNPQALNEMISKYIALIPQSFSGSGFSLGGSGKHAYFVLISFFFLTFPFFFLNLGFAKYCTSKQCSNHNFSLFWFF